MSMTLRELFLDAGRRYGDRVALRGHGEERTYRQLIERGARLANALAGLGIRPGEHVAALLEDRVAAFEVYVGCALGGYPVVHVNDRLTADEVAHILEDGDARVLIHTDGTTPTVEQLGGRDDLAAVVTLGADRSAGAHEYEELLASASARTPESCPEPEDLAILGYTSGTTGFPKGAMVSHRAVVACARLVAHTYRLPMYGSCAFTGTLSFASGIWGVIIPHLYLGARVDFLFPYTIETWIDHVITTRSTFTYAPSPLVPGLVEELRRRPEALDSLQSVMHSASPLPRAHAKELAEVIGDRFVEVWGMTESVGPVSATTRQDYRGHTSPDDLYATVGRPVAAAGLRVVAADGATLPPGETGELVIETETLFSGYYRDPTKTAEVLRDGEYWTGDVGHVDAAGYVYVTDRAKDLIISGGMNVYPAEIEGVLTSLSGVVEVAVFGAPHERWGETPVVALVARRDSGLTEAQVLAHVTKHLASYKKPSRVVFLEALPRNASLKIQKHELRAQLSDRSVT